MRGFDLIYLFSLVDSTLRGARLAVGGTCLIEQAVPRDIRDTLIFILALHEPNLLRPRCASTACSGSFRALVSPSLHSSLERKLLVSHFLDPFKTTSQGRLIKIPQTAGR